jgi:charged multivesicular body protein 5
MQAAAKEMKTQFKRKELDINAIDKLNDEMADLMAMNADIQDAMGRNYAVPDDLDEEELLGELEALEDDLASEVAAPDATPSYLLDADLPAPPTATPATAAHAAPEVNSPPAATL